MSYEIETEVVVVGGGLSGAILAYSLAHSNIRTILIDKIDLSNSGSLIADGRTTAIAQASQILLKKIGVWSEIENVAENINEIRVSEENSNLFLHYDHKDIGPDPLGYMVENYHLRFHLLKLMKASKDLKIMAPVDICSVQTNHNNGLIQLTNGASIKAKLVCAADGRTSRIRGIAKIEVNKWDYNQTAIITNIDHKNPHQCIAHEKFFSSGPFAILPLKGQHTSSIVWTEESSLAKSALKLEPHEFQNEIQKRVGSFLGDITLNGSRYSHPVGLQIAQTYIAERIVLVGDAAHSIHPIAGQGLNLGIRDIGALIDLLVESKRYGLDIGSYNTIHRYQKWRRADNLLMGLVTDGLNRLFSNSIPIMKLSRRTGLASLNKFSSLKNIFMMQAMGKSGDLPTLMRD
ncbi:MAG: 2-octaprenyl-6-methoxyphenyl hydroxylase [Rhodospirillaceae bacterium]|nr:2-octaprenyl-6-methoxyphenyl hydroxylase [Rhodospirillaceae bacterium]|tara:strand:+ start:282 stop:1493 length:1212 start_codon:yes stop_codon:yes gene_type:complete